MLPRALPHASRVRTALLALLVHAAFAAPAAAQCSQWSPTTAVPGVDGQVLDLVAFDTGAGERLYATALVYTSIGLPEYQVLEFDGAQRRALPAFGSQPYFSALGAFDSGGGIALYASGAFRSTPSASAIGNVLRWNGSAWSPLSTGFGGTGSPSVDHLAVFDPGTGARLYAAGSFLTVASQVVNRIASYDGASWSPLSSGVDGTVNDLLVFDDGSGPALYVSGSFTHAGGVPADGIARWNGTSWSAVGSPFPGAKDALAGLRDPNGRQLFVSRVQNGTPPPPDSITRWNGTSWSTATNGLPGTPLDLHVHGGASGSELYACGTIVQWTGTSNTSGFVARWNGSAWTTVGSTPITPSTTQITRLTSAGTGAARRLVCSGIFHGIEDVGAASIAVYDGAHWSAAVPGDGFGWDSIDDLHSGARALLAHDDGHGRALFACGGFQFAGAAHVDHVARWNGTAWSAVGGGLDAPASALCEYDDGNGLALHCGGLFANAGGVPCARIARWNGTTWSPLGSGLDGEVKSLVVHDDGTGTALYAAGTFLAAGGGLASNVARWNGTSWSAVGAGLPTGQLALAVHDAGAGPELYSGGTFSLAGSIQRWNGSAWSVVPGSPFWSYALASFDDGSGPALYVGSDSDGIAQRWNGTSWSPIGGATLGGGVFASVRAFYPHDDGSGPALYVGGTFYTVGNATMPRIARWNGRAWSALGAGIEGPVTSLASVHALTAYDSGAGPELWAGGNFKQADGKPAGGLARWSYCFQPWRVTCAGDGSGSACPCNNSGSAYRGCRSSTNPSGARLAMTGTPSVANDTSALVLDGATPAQPALFLQSDARENGGLGAPSFDGVRCVAGTITRLGARTTQAGAARYPESFDPPLAQSGAVTQPGTRLHYQVFYRDPSAAFCPPATANWSNTITATWQP